MSDQLGPTQYWGYLDNTSTIQQQQASISTSSIGSMITPMIELMMMMFLMSMMAQMIRVPNK